MPNIIIEYNNEAAKIVGDLIETVDEHKPLSEAKIICLWTSQKMKHADKVVLGKATKQGAITKFFASGDDELVASGPDFVLVFNRNQWAALSEKGRLALVDHELMHCCQRSKISKSGKVTKSWGLRGHDLEEFVSVLERHGQWNRDVTRFSEALSKQLELVAS